jgi:hypothetical protein
MDCSFEVAIPVPVAKKQDSSDHCSNKINKTVKIDW